MNRLEIAPGEGGEDAVLFARELADSVSNYAQQAVEFDGTTLIISGL